MLLLLQCSHKEGEIDNPVLLLHIAGMEHIGSVELLSILGSEFSQRSQRVVLS